MNVAMLSLEQTPPFSVPLPFFLAAPLFGIAAVGLLALAEPAALSRWHPALLGATHFLTLGYLALVMCGAMFQLLPVLVGVRVNRPRLVAGLVWALLVTGSALLGAGLWRAQPLLLMAAGTLLGGALLLFLVALGHALWRARARSDSVTAMRLALVALAATLVLGLWLLAGHLGHTPLRRDLTGLHLAWGLLGWVGVLLAGVAYQVVPMFQVTAEYPPRLRGRWPWAVLALLAVTTAGALWQPALEWLPGLLLAVSFALFAAVTLRLQARRLRRLPDITVDFWRVGMGAIIAAAGLWAVLALWPLSPAWRGIAELWWGVLVIVGGGVSVVAGMLYKIVPFLVWLHLHNRLQQASAWQGRVPTMRQVVAERHTRWHLYLHGAALLMLLPAVAWPQWLWYPALAVLAGAFALQWWNLLGALRTYRRIAAEMGA